MSISEGDTEGRLVEYILEHGDGLEFTRCFWRGCEPLPRDVELYSLFAQVTRKTSLGEPVPNIIGQIAVGLGSVDTWQRLESMPKLAHYLKAHIELGPPRPGHVWLNTEGTHGQALPVGQFLQVPLKVETWSDILFVADQLRSISDVDLSQNRHYVLGFFLGIMIGDASKKKQGRGHRHVDLMLSKRYETNLKIGEYTSLCAQALGLRMHRLKDVERYKDKPHGFYEWSSQASSLIDWLFNVALGLREGEHTTYDPIHADWVLEAPLDFRLGLIQGIAESDGSVNISSQEVEFWIGPNWEWMIMLLQTFGLRGFRNREAVTISKNQARASLGVPIFSPYLETVRFQKLRIMCNARTLEKRERLPVELRSNIMSMVREGSSIPRIGEDIAENNRVLISFEGAQRWALKTGIYQPTRKGRTRQASAEALSQ